METTPAIQDPEVNDTTVTSIDNASSTVDLSEIVARDPRAAHFIVDLLAGVEAGEAASRHFSRLRRLPTNRLFSKPRIEAICADATKVPRKS